MYTQEWHKENAWILRNYSGWEISIFFHWKWKNPQTLGSPILYALLYILFFLITVEQFQVLSLMSRFPSWSGVVDSFLLVLKVANTLVILHIMQDINTRAYGLFYGFIYGLIILEDHVLCLMQNTLKIWNFNYTCSHWIS